MATASPWVGSALRGRLSASKRLKIFFNRVLSTWARSQLIGTPLSCSPRDFIECCIQHGSAVLRLHEGHDGIHEGSKIDLACLFLIHRSGERLQLCFGRHLRDISPPDDVHSTCLDRSEIVKMVLASLDYITFFPPTHINIHSVCVDKSFGYTLLACDSQ